MQERGVERDLEAPRGQYGLALTLFCAALLQRALTCTLDRRTVGHLGPGLDRLGRWETDLAKDTGGAAGVRGQLPPAALAAAWGGGGFRRQQVKQQHRLWELLRQGEKMGTTAGRRAGL